MSLKRQYSPEPEDSRAHVRAQDRAYSRFAGLYDVAVKRLPVWKGWLRRALPHLKGPRVLEVSFGTGYLLTQYAGRFDAYGLDLTRRMVETARRNVAGAGLRAALVQADAAAIPFRDQSFDSVLCTMAFTAYPDSRRAMSELLRVLREDGRLVLVDVGYPADGNRLGTRLAGFWRRLGDIIRDMDRLFDEFDMDYRYEEIGGWGTVHLYVATRRR